MQQPQWFKWARRIQAIAQTGLTYTKDPYDVQRYEELRELAAEIAAANLDLPAEQLTEVFAVEKGYPTPKVDVRSVVFDQGKILLARETQDGRWSLPGGWADVGETIGEIAARETQEETGYVVRPVKLLAVWDRDRQGHPPMLQAIYKVFVLCELVGGGPATSLETSAVGFFDRQDLPPLSTPRVLEVQIRRMFEHHDNPDLPTDFD